MPRPLRIPMRILAATLLALLTACGSAAPAAEAPAPAPTAPPAVAPAADLGRSAAGESPAGDEPSGFLPEGPLVADSGFRPAPDGFSFENYGSNYPSEPPTFTIEGARYLLGDEAVCAGITPDGTCVPSPLAEQWISQMNEFMNGGRCEGFSALSQKIYLQQLPAADLESGAQAAFDLQREDPEVTELISAYAASQFLEPVASATGEARQLTPADILDRLIEGLQPGADMPTLGIYQDGQGGHAVVPFAVEDKGDGLFWVWVYDNNYPGSAKYVEINRDANTWSYALAALNPSEDSAPWAGDATSFSMDLTPASARQLPLACPFCAEQTAAAEGKGASRRVVYSTGSSHVLIRDSQGRRLGTDRGRHVSEIPGATSAVSRSATWGSQETVFFLPPTSR